MRYRIHIDSPRHRVHNEYFVEFRRSDLGAESVHTEPDGATWVSLETARIALRRLREPQYRLRCRLLDEHGSVCDNFENAPSAGESLNVHNYTENTIYRDRFEGRSLELPLLHNKAVGKWFLKFSTSSNPDDPPDLSISGVSPEDVFERFTTNPHWRRYHDRFVVEEIHEQPAATPVSSTPAVQIQVPVGHELVAVSWRPGNNR